MCWLASKTFFLLLALLLVVKCSLGRKLELYRQPYINIDVKKKPRKKPRGHGFPRSVGI